MKDERSGWGSARRRNRSVALPGLRVLRQSKGLTQRELARLAGVSTGTVYRLESGRRGAYPVSVRKLASALGVSPGDLLLGNGPRRAKEGCRSEKEVEKSV